MVVSGFTGGIGAGKSTFAAMLGELGAAVVDVDAVGRTVISKAGPGAGAILERFGTLDRREIAAVVFADPKARHDLEQISWPLIEAELVRVIERPRVADVVILDMAVLAQGLGRGLYGPVITVEAPVPLRLRRLIDRGLSEDDARARMQSQVSEVEREALADLVVVNEGDLVSLAEAARAGLERFGPAPAGG